MKLFFIILIIILFTPIPLNISIYYSRNNYYINLYKFTIMSKDKIKKNVKNSTSSCKNKKKKKESLKLLSLIHKKFLIENLYNSKFKFKIKLNGKLDYSFNDAAKTAIAYGLFSQITPILYFITNILFKIKNFKIDLNPIFEDKFLVKLEISSIIFISIAKIIYILIIIFKSILYSEEVDPYLGKNYDK